MPFRKRAAWEVDWSKRRRENRQEQPKVWARNPNSPWPHCREWHWTSHATLAACGVKWQKVRERPGKYQKKNGYLLISRWAMTAEQIAIADANNIWDDRQERYRVAEHRLVAAIKYGTLPKGCLVRHLNGDKADNRPENLALGTYKDNKCDHKTAVLEMMRWRDRALMAEAALEKRREKPAA